MTMPDSDYPIPGLIKRQALDNPRGTAVNYRDQSVDYETLWRRVCGYRDRLLSRTSWRHQQPVIVHLENCLEGVCALFGIMAAGGIAVPVHAGLKAAQLEDICLRTAAGVLISDRLRSKTLARMPANIEHVDLVDIPADDSVNDPAPAPRPWQSDDLAMILFTSGSTGKPKGVMLSHQNLHAGARSVCTYLEQRGDDRILGLLPFSFDYGFSQLTTAFYSGAAVYIINYLVPNDVLVAVERHHITGIGAIPTLWIPLSRLNWPAGCREHLRYITNSGGKLPLEALNALRSRLPDTQIYLMYGLTEAFRSTYLDPAQLDKRPQSMGKAIPGANVVVVNDRGLPCQPGEPGQLVHMGDTVSRGYWRDTDATDAVFRAPPPWALSGDSQFHTGPDAGQKAVWSGDTVKMDQEGFLYFLHRADEMIKSSGYRISPTEIEEVFYQHPKIQECAVFASPHSLLGQAVMAAVVLNSAMEDAGGELIKFCRGKLPNYMIPKHIEIMARLPKTAHHKVDRKLLAQQFRDFFNHA